MLVRLGLHLLLLADLLLAVLVCLEGAKKFYLLLFPFALGWLGVGLEQMECF